MSKISNKQNDRYLLINQAAEVWVNILLSQIYYKKSIHGVVLPNKKVNNYDRSNK